MQVYSREQILNLVTTTEDSELAPALLEIVEAAVDDDFEHEFEIVSSLSRGFRVVYATWYLEAEVANAGLLQYFFNSTGRFAAYALEGYRLIQAVQHASAVDKAITTFGLEQPMLSSIWETSGLEESYRLSSLPQLDDVFMSLTEDVNALRNRFIREHPEEFAP